MTPRPLPEDLSASVRPPSRLARVGSRLLPRTDTEAGVARELLAITSHVGARPTDVRLVLGTTPKLDIDHYEIQSGDTHLWVKMRRCGPVALAWREREEARQASNQRLGPKVLPIRGARQSIVMDIVAQRPLAAAQAALGPARLAVLSLLRSLHRSVPQRGLAPRDVAADAFDRWRAAGFAHRAPLPPLLTTAPLLAHMDQISLQLTLRPGPQALCHGAPLLKHLLVHQGSAALIDWSTAHWGDPLRDVACFMVHAQVAVGEVDGLLNLYLLRPADAHERQTLLLWMQTLQLDAFAQDHLNKHATAAQVCARARRIVLFAHVLGVPAPHTWWHPLAEPTLVRTSQWELEAETAAQDVLGPAYALMRHRGPRRELAFSALGDGRRLHIELHGVGTSHTAQDVIAYAGAAAALGLGPKVYAAARAPHALVTHWTAGTWLGPDDVFNYSYQNQIAQGLGRLHREPSLQAAQGRPSQGVAAWPLAGWDAFVAAGHRPMAPNRSLIDVASMAHHMQAVRTALTQDAIVAAPCHGQLTRHHVLRVGGRMHLLGWAHARWGDPLGDLARFYAQGSLLAHEVPVLLGCYFGHAATPHEVRHFILALQAFCIDRTAVLLRRAVARETDLHAVATQMLDLGEAMPDLPALRLCASA